MEELWLFGLVVEEQHEPSGVFHIRKYPTNPLINSLPLKVGTKSSPNQNVIDIVSQLSSSILMKSIFILVWQTHAQKLTHSC